MFTTVPIRKMIFCCTAGAQKNVSFYPACATTACLLTSKLAFISALMTRRAIQSLKKSLVKVANEKPGSQGNSFECEGNKGKCLFAAEEGDETQPAVGMINRLMSGEEKPSLTSAF